MRRWSATVWVVFGLELRRWWREPLAVAIALIVPASVACVVTGALGGGAGYETSWAVVDLDEGPVGDAFLTEVGTSSTLREIVTVRDANRGAARDMLARYEVSAVITLPRDLSESVVAGDHPAITVDAPEEPGIGTDVAYVTVDAFVVRAWAERAAAQEPGRHSPAPLGVALEGLGGRSLDAAAHFGPSVALFFLFLSLGFGAQRAVSDRQNRIDDRLRVAAVPTSAVAAARALFGVAVGALSLTVTGVVMTLAFERGWGPAATLAPFVVAVLVCFTGVAALVSQVARSPGAVQMTTMAVAFVSTVGSGGFSPPGAMSPPGFGRSLPTSRALDVFARIATEGTRLAALQFDLLYLAGFGVLAAMAAGAVGRAFR